ncbi:MAG: metalloregulator ArsR/SmtB family transcription factor [Acidobacteria bacterium]|nr:metalloregulator ArsR/SmtB family transcription factor [Acidobacteriota bacterium]
MKLSSSALDLVASRFKVLGDPLRLQILQVLDERECTVGELARLLETSQPTVSKHVRILDEAGLLARRHVGTAVYCSIADATVHELCEVVCGSLRKRLALQVDSLGVARRRAVRSPGAAGRGERRPATRT